jgi:formamidopyrimidine-DNA glycosylase
MPELPEVETVCRGLERTIKGKTLETLSLFRADLRFPLDMEALTSFAPCHITNIHRRAKWIVITNDMQQCLLIHLGMSGTILYHSTRKETVRHDHMHLYFHDGSMVAFKDPRRFGMVATTSNALLAQHPYLKALGLEPFAPECNAAYLATLFAHKTQAIKLALMDAHIVVGIGNIYASEALFRARIHPATPAKMLSLTQIESLLGHIRDVLQEAIASGGSSLRDFVRSSGDSGYFQHHFLVYDRKGAPCPRCHTPIAHMKQAGRSTYFCPVCSPLSFPSAA